MIFRKGEYAGAYRGKSARGVMVSLLMLALLLSGCKSANTAVNEPKELSEASENNDLESASTGNHSKVQTVKVGEESKRQDAVITKDADDKSQEAEELSEVEEEIEQPEETPEETEDNSKDVDLIFFMGQSNMSGCGGDFTRAPQVIPGAGYEFRAVTDPFNLHDIVEPFGINESILGAIWDVPGAKRGSLVSSFVNRYYEHTGRCVIAVSASAGGTSTTNWLSEGFTTDISLRVKNAQDYLNNNGYNVGHQYVVWLQGESDALNGTSAEGYKTNLDNIIRPLFVAGFDKVFIITPGRVKNNSEFFNNIINSQIAMCQNTGYYALATTMLCVVDPSYMVDVWHYNQDVLNLLGSEAADSVAFFTNNNREMCIYDYKHGEVYVPKNYGYEDGEQSVECKDINGILSSMSSE